MRVDLGQFDEAYRSDADPWDFATSDYEQRKYAITLASLPLGRYRRCFEPGCSVGVLTSMLATRCDKVVAMEASSAACETASRRLRSFKNVEVVHGSIPEMWPRGPFDLEAPTHE
jgi:protein-L-isoaspartate O-methyltransferase